MYRRKAATCKLLVATAYERGKEDLSSFNKSSVNGLSPLFCGSLSLKNKVEEEKNVKKQWKNHKNSSNSNSSTLSLHISAYENSVEINDAVGKKTSCLKLEKQKLKSVKHILSGSTSSIENPFEFPRQQEADKMDNPEVMKFKTSTRLLNPNQTTHPPPQHPQIYYDPHNQPYYYYNDVPYLYFTNEPYYRNPEKNDATENVAAAEEVIASSNNDVPIIEIPDTQNPLESFTDESSPVSASPPSGLTVSASIPPVPPGFTGLPPAPSGLTGLPPAPPGLTGLPPAPPGLTGLPPAPPGFTGFPPAPSGFTGFPPAPSGFTGFPPAPSGFTGFPSVTSGNTMALAIPEASFATQRKEGNVWPPIMRSVENGTTEEKVLFLSNIVQSIFTEMKANTAELKSALKYTVSAATSEGVDLLHGTVFDPDRIRKSYLVSVKFYDMKEPKSIDLCEKLRNCTSLSEHLFEERYIKKLFKELMVEVYGKDKLCYYSAASEPQKIKGYTKVSPALISATLSIFQDALNIPEIKSHQSPGDAYKILKLSEWFKDSSFFGNSRRQPQNITPKQERKAASRTTPAAKKPKLDEEPEIADDDAEIYQLDYLLNNGHYDLPTAKKLIAELSTTNDQAQNDNEVDMDYEEAFSPTHDSREPDCLSESSKTSEASADEEVEEPADIVFGVLGADEQNLIFLYDIFTKYTSDKAIKDRILSDNARFGTSNLVTYNDVKIFKAAVTSKYQIEQTLLCCTCEHEIPHGTSKCSNCFTQNRAAKESRPTGISVASIIPQIYDILKRTSTLLVKPDGPNRGELGHFPNSQMKFIDEKTVLLQIMLNSDGVTPKQNYRGSFWPFFMEIAQLPAHIRGNFANIAIGGFITCSSKPPAAATQILIGKLKKDLIFLRDEGLHLGDICYKFSVEHLILDLDAVVHFFRTPTCQSISYACPTCVVLPKRITHKSLWPLLRRDYENRRAETIIDDMKQKRFGFDGVPPIMEISNPLNIRIDALHVLDEGLLGRVLDIYFKRNKEQMSVLSRIYLNCKYPSFFDPKPRSLMEYGSYNGGDKRLLFFNMLPVILLEDFDRNPQKSATLLSLWYCIRLIASKKLNVSLIQWLKRFIPQIAAKLESQYPEQFEQLKSHIFFVHLLDEIESYGSPYDFTASTFESGNRKAKAYFDINDTRSMAHTILQRSLNRREVEIRIKTKLNEECSPQFREVFKKKFSGNTYILKPSPSSSRTLCDNSIIVVKIQNEICFCRVQRVTEDSKFIVKKFLGRNIMEVAGDKTTGEVLKRMIAEMSNLLPFGFVATSLSAEEYLISLQQVIDYCCLILYNDKSYIFTVDYRGPCK